MNKNTIIDFHCHILPGIDDGSRNEETSLRMLSMQQLQNVKEIIATPHFYADQQSMDAFLEKRRLSYEKMQTYLQEQKEDGRIICGDEWLPKIRLGAEAAYFAGMGKADQIRKLTIEDTGLLLVEMPFESWRESVLEDIRELITRQKLTVILAHVERYLGFRGNKNSLLDLLDETAQMAEDNKNSAADSAGESGKTRKPLYTQINAESLLDWHTRRKVLSLIRKGNIDLLGSDSHGAHHRVPNLEEGRAVIAKKLGEEYLSRIDETGSLLLNI